MQRKAFSLTEIKKEIVQCLKSKYGLSTKCGKEPIQSKGRYIHTPYYDVTDSELRHLRNLQDTVRLKYTTTANSDNITQRGIHLLTMLGKNMTN